MNTNKQIFKNALYTVTAVTVLSCSKDKENEKPTVVPIGQTAYILGLGVSTTDATNHYVLPVENLMSGTISLLNKGVLQEGYREYAQVGANFYSVGGLGLSDATTYFANGNVLGSKTGLNFQQSPVDTQDPDGTGKQLLVVTVPANPAAGTEMQFITVDAASNTLQRTVKVGIDKAKFKINGVDDWIMHTGIAVRGNQAFQSFLPINPTTWATTQIDKAFVAVYSYPDFVLQKVIEDDRTGPAGAFNTRSGIFVTESGDIYTISHQAFGYQSSTKKPGILKIPAGSTEFDNDYHFKTAEAEDGGGIIHAIYVGNNKLLAAINDGTQSTNQDMQWLDNNLRFAIVDLAAQTITPATGTPTFKGEGGHSFPAFYDNGKVYASGTVNNTINIYEIDIATATVRKGALVDAAFVSGIGRIK